ncbi:MAG: DUF4258 domain-containing protein [Defluviitaleaceae bacterium]|nr:DUF4258 domain-containing protein [Defluviitaleaceae bacterium]MCL2276020.1 DUF4258 domain-containing protein [Defluviitaleaceae bacterium]
MMQIIDIKQIVSLVKASKILWTEHVAIRLRERNIKRADLIHCVCNGKIIEQYPTDTPYPSCLILGFTQNNEPLHVVVGLNVNVICSIITVYHPDKNRWEHAFSKRKDG